MEVIYMAAGCSESSSWQGHSGDYRRCQTQIRARKKITSAARKSLGKACERAALTRRRLSASAQDDLAREWRVHCTHTTPP